MTQRTRGPRSTGDRREPQAGSPTRTIGKMPSTLKLRAGCPCFPSNGWVRGEGDQLVPCPAPGHADEYPAQPDPVTAWNLTDTSPANPMTGACEECGDRVALVDRCPIGMAVGRRQCRPCGAVVWAAIDSLDAETAGQALAREAGAR